ncbi:hypothetical protein BHM03_00036135, partial [Ensete ventricosum]
AWRRLPPTAHLLPQLVSKKYFRTRQSFSCSTTIASAPTCSDTIFTPFAVVEGFYTDLLCCSNNPCHITAPSAESIGVCCHTTVATGVLVPCYTRMSPGLVLSTSMLPLPPPVFCFSLEQPTRLVSPAHFLCSAHLFAEGGAWKTLDE